MSDTHLSNVQLELLKLYSTNLTEKDLTALKKLLAKFYAERAIQTADQIWDQKKLTDKDMEAWLNEG
jgi:transcription initiation factor IIE alpha subunit